MTYSGSLNVHDADSHLMEPVGWLEDYADDKTRTALEKANASVAGIPDQIIQRFWDRRNDPEKTARLAADVIGGPKGFAAYGAMDSAERKLALDQMGYVTQVVFPTMAIPRFAFHADQDLLYWGASALIRGMVDFCSVDKRLLPVVFIPMDDPERSTKLVEEAVESGARVAWIPHDVPKDKSPTHPAFDGVWARLAEARIPIVLHIGGTPDLGTLPRTYNNNGRTRGKDFGGGEDSLRSKDFVQTHHMAETLLGCLVFDGIFEKFAGLKCFLAELGARWVPSFLQSLDGGLQFGQFEAELKKLTLKPSDYIRRQVKFAPWHFEDVAWLVGNDCADLLLYSSDWPHPEGGKDPIGAFRDSLASFGADQDVQRKFFHDNMAELLGTEGAALG